LPSAFAEQAHLESDLVVVAGVNLEAVAVARQADGRPLEAANNLVNMIPTQLNNFFCRARG